MTIENLSKIITVGHNKLRRLSDRIDANQTRRNELRNDIKCEIESLKSQIEELQHYIEFLDENDQQATKIERTLDSAATQIESAYRNAKTAQTSARIDDIAMRVSSILNTTCLSATSAVEDLESTVQEISHQAY